MTILAIHDSKHKIQIPNQMEGIFFEKKHRVAMTKIAVSIFEDTVNSGNTFQDALLAIYLSGIENAISSEANKNAL
jgi:hypothetical protein